MAWAWKKNARNRWAFVAGAALLALAGGCNKQAEKNTAGEFRPVEEGDSATSKSDAGAAPKVDAAKESAVSSDTTKPETASGKSATGKKTDDPALAGPTREKVEMMRKLAEPKVTGKTEQQKIQSLNSQLQARLQLAEDILATKNAPQEAKIEALEARLEVQSMFVGMEVEGARENFVIAAQDLAAVPNPEKAIVGKVHLFMLDVIKLLELKPRDGKKVVAAIEDLLKEGGDYPEVLQASASAVQQLEQLGYSDDATAALKMIGDHFAANKNPELALQGKQLQLSALLMNLRHSEGEEAQKLGDEILAKSQSLVDSSHASEAVLDTLQEVARLLESNPSPEIAGKMYDLLEKSYGDSKNQKLAEMVQQSVANARKRLALIGKPFSLEGALLDGKPFQWDDYQGKVVLVDFWATWCIPCLQEMSNIKQNYDKYHKQGFEVVGVNLDDDLATVEEFFANQPLPWTTVVGKGEAERGFAHPAAVKCGVNAIPFVVLVGRDGKVAGIHVRGERLEKALSKMLASQETPAEESSEPAEEKANRSDAVPENSLR
jgi:thiol-disulfide isomerase/thioredoxin